MINVRYKMKKWIAIPVLILTAVFICQQVRFYRQAAPIYKAMRDLDYSNKSLEFARSVKVTDLPYDFTSNEDSLIALSREEQSYQKIDGIEIHTTTPTSDVDIYNTTIIEASRKTPSESYKQKFNSFIGDTPLETQANILRYQDPAPSIFASPESRIYDLSIISTKLSSLGGDKYYFIDTDVWQALIFEKESKKAKVYVCDYYHIADRFGVTLYLLNRSPENSFTIDRAMRILSRIVFN
jgi:hypothetical protein